MRLAHTLAVAATLLGLAAAQSQPQTCYYPDGSVAANDRACPYTAACCGANAYCMDHGLCLSGAILSRSSCTDKTWQNGTCPGYCKSDTPSGPSSITPCATSGDTSTFACGIGNNVCGSSDTFAISGAVSFVLRPAQIAALVGGAISQAAPAANSTNSTAADSASSGGTFTAAALIGVAAGMGVPMIIAIGLALWFWQKTRESKPRLMYPLPDENKSEFSFRPPPPMSPGYPPSPGSVHSAFSGVSAVHHGTAEAKTMSMRTASVAATSTTLVNNTGLGVNVNGGGGRATPIQLQAVPTDRYKSPPPHASPRSAAYQQQQQKQQGNPLGSPVSPQAQFRGGPAVRTLGGTQQHVHSNVVELDSRGITPKRHELGPGNGSDAMSVQSSSVQSARSATRGQVREVIMSR